MTSWILNTLELDLMQNPPYNPDMVPLDYYLFSYLQLHLDGTIFHSNDEVNRFWTRARVIILSTQHLITEQPPSSLPSKTFNFRTSGRSQVKPHLPNQSSSPIVMKYLAKRKTPLSLLPYQRLSDMGWSVDFSPYAQRHIRSSERSHGAAGESTNWKGRVRPSGCERKPHCSSTDGPNSICCKHQQGDDSALENVHRCPTRRVSSNS
ncbi:hypothetical protein TNCV_1888331 [Trichonephila clavipes]|nr:hypothetical protein TNCV_1888331 [Trichonephila clavipes]